MLLQKIYHRLLTPLIPKGITPTALTYRKIGYAVIFCLPMLFIIALIAVYPVYRTIITSFTDAELISFPGYSWVGFENYRDVLQDPQWWQCVYNTFVFASLATIIQVGLGLATALLIDFKFRGEKLLKILVMLPWSILVVVAIQIWLHLFNSSYGIINVVLQQLGLLTGNFNWFQHTAAGFAALIITDTWRSFPFVTVLLLSALQTIPIEQWEASRICGISPLRHTWCIVLPQIKRMLAVVTVFRWLDGMRVFELIYLMTSNAKSNASISIYARDRLLEFSEAGAGSAAAILISLMLVSMVLLTGLILQKISQGESK